MNKKIRKELELLLPLVLTYGADYFKFKNIEEIVNLTKEQRRLFIEKCNEGYKHAQNIVINSLLKLEEEEKNIKSQLNSVVKGKHKNEYKNNENYKNLSKKLDDLIYHKLVLREVIEIIVWTIYGMQRTHVKAQTISTDSGKGYLSDKNFQSVLTVAKKLNADPSSFALITDITKSIGVGDIILVKNNSRSIIEVKEGKVNDLIMDILEEKDIDKREFLSKMLVDQTGMAGIKQFERFTSQHKRSSDVLNYLKNDEAYDNLMKKPKKAFELKTMPVYMQEEINNTVTRFIDSSDEEAFLTFDVGYIGIFKGSGLAKELDFKHFIYHVTNSWDDCMWEKKNESNLKKAFGTEFAVYDQIPIHSLRRKLSIWSHMPIPITLAPNCSISLLSKEISIFTYVDGDNLFSIAEGKAMNPEWLSEKQMLLRHNQQELIFFPKFNGKYLSFKFGKNYYDFTFGFLFRIVYEFETGSGVLDQAKEFYELIENPLLN